MLHKLKQQFRNWLYRYFRDEIHREAMRHSARSQSFVPVKLAYDFRVSYEALRGMGNYPLGSQQVIDAQIEKGKRELYKDVMKHVQVTSTDDYPDFGKRYRIEIMVWREKGYTPASYQTKG